MNTFVLTSLKNGLIFLTCYICSSYIYIKVNKIKLHTKIVVSLITFALIISVVCTSLKSIHFIYYGIVYIVLTISSFFLLKRDKYYITIPSIILSLGTQYGIEILSIIILVSLFYACNYYEVNLFTESLASFLQIVLTILFMRIPRLKNGFSFLINKNNFGISLLIAGPLIVFINYQKAYVSESILSVIAIGIVISATGLFIWIRSAFTRYYRKRLKLRAEEYSKIELTEKSEEIKKLTSENTSLSSIIHLDNHIIQTIETELKELNDNKLTEKLLISINQRNEYVNDTLVKSKNLPSTGSADIDALLADLYIKSASRGIDFNLNADCDINYLLNNIITKDDFETLLRNTITTSIVDIENNPDTNGKILIIISKPNDIYEFTIMDSGISDDENIKSISEIIENSNASIKTNKFDNNDSFTKSLTIRFDG